MRNLLLAFVVFAYCSLSATARIVSSLSRRTTTDTCANLFDAPVRVTIIPGSTVVIGLINVCLCLSGIPDFVRSNIVAQAAVAVAGVAATDSALTNLVNSAAGSRECTYPDNAVPICLASNPCSFGCSNGFSPTIEDTACVCEPPNIVCNGICGNYRACPSAVPPLKRAAGLRARATCAVGLTACGVYGWGGARSAHAWECLDTASDLESCGGCAVPLSGGGPHGRDCTAIMGVAGVSCAAGKCAVQSCLPGYVVSEDGTFCVRTRALADAALLGQLEPVPGAAAYRRGDNPM